MHALILIENEAEATRFLELNKSGAVGDATALSLSPWAEHRLERLGIRYQRLEDYCLPGELDQVGLNNSDNVAAWTAYLDGLCHSRFRELDDSFQPAMAAFFWLKIMCDAVVLRTFELNRVFQQARPVKVLAFRQSSRPDRPTAFDFVGESIYSELLPLLAIQFEVPITLLERVPRDPCDSSKFWVKNTHESWLFKARWLRAITCSTLRFNGRNKPRVLILDRSLAMPLLSRRDVGAVYWDTSSGKLRDLSGIPIARKGWPRSDPPISKFRTFTHDLWHDLVKDEEFRQYFVINDFDIFSIVESRLQRLVAETMPLAYEMYSTASGNIASWKPRAIICRNLSEVDHRVIAQAARGWGIPVVVYDHGAMGYFKFPMEKYLDVALADVRLVWGEGVARHSRQEFPDGPTVIPVGSLELDTLQTRTESARSENRRRLCRQLGLDPERVVILYPLTVLFGNNRYLPHVVCSDSEYYRWQRRIIQVIKDFPDVQCVVKLHPNPQYQVSPIVEYVEEEHVANCIFVDGLPFADLLDVGDLFLNDSPTTTLLQMLTTGRRILVLGPKSMHWRDEVLPLLARSVVFCPDIDQFENCLRDHLRKRIFEPVPGADGEFLRQFGTCGRDGNASFRLAAAVESIVRTPQPERMA